MEGGGREMERGERYRKKKELMEKEIKREKDADRQRGGERGVREVGVRPFESQYESSRTRPSRQY